MIMTLEEMIEHTKVETEGTDFNKKEILKKARIVNNDELKVDTIIDGVLETTNTAKKGDYILTGPKGEEYVLTGVKFEKFYEPHSDGMFKSKPDNIKAIQLKEGIEFTAPWGETMKAEAGDYIVFRSKTDAYRVEKQIFEETYEHIKNKI